MGGLVGGQAWLIDVRGVAVDGKVSLCVGMHNPAGMSLFGKAI
jgi:hypothetical protein